MLQVEKREIATRLFEDMADSRSGKLDDEMTELGLWRSGHLLEVGTSHRSSSRLTSVVRSLEVRSSPVTLLFMTSRRWSCRTRRSAAPQVRRPRGYHRFPKARCNRPPMDTST